MASQPTLEELIEPYLTVQSVVVAPVATLSPMFVVYGMYTIVFGLCMHVLLNRQRSQLGLYLWCTISLFTLASLYVGMQAFGMTREATVMFRAVKTKELNPMLWYLIRGDARKNAWLFITFLVPTLMNSLADVMLIHRCYILWDSKKTVLYTLGVGAFILNGVSLGSVIARSIGAADPLKFYVYREGVRISDGTSLAIAVFNGLLSLLTAGRIWWISQKVRQQMGSSVRDKYTAIVAIILESGLLYPTTLIATIVVARTQDPEFHGTVQVDLQPLANLMAGLAPTLIIVRVAYRRSVDSVEQMMSIHFAEHSSSQGTRQGTSTLQTTVDIRSQSHISALGGHRVDGIESEEKIGSSEGRVIDPAKVA